jgi:hypothetical protein
LDIAGYVAEEEKVAKAGSHVGLPSDFALTVSGSNR